MDNYANESVLLFGDEKLTAIYQDIVTQYNRMIQLSGRDANVGISKNNDNTWDTEMMFLHDGMPEYADVVSYIVEHIREPLVTHILSVVSREFTDLWCGSIWYTSISLVDVDGTYDKPNDVRDEVLEHALSTYSSVYVYFIIGHVEPGSAMLAKVAHHVDALLTTFYADIIP